MCYRNPRAEPEAIMPQHPEWFLNTVEPIKAVDSNQFRLWSIHTVYSAAAEV